ncbi:hypothetical protein CE91St46_06630 [Eubacteriales bacterium]|nr:hypothetical protein CE91St46_06630 [Eubacteriales bacterium]GKH62193.1 hypothetical protein CE91St47_06620 [Eubacteriales bacterium]
MQNAECILHRLGLRGPGSCFRYWAGPSAAGQIRASSGCGTADWTGTAASQECRRAADARTLRFPDDDFGTGKAYYQLQ